MQTPCAVLGVRYVSRWQWTTQKSGSSTQTVPRQILRVCTWIVRTSRLMCRCHCLLDPSCDMRGVNSYPVLRRGGTFVAPSEILQVAPPAHAQAKLAQAPRSLLQCGRTLCH